MLTLFNNRVEGAYDFGNAAYKAMGQEDDKWQIVRNGRLAFSDMKIVKTGDAQIKNANVEMIQDMAEKYPVGTLVRDTDRRGIQGYVEGYQVYSDWGWLIVRDSV